MTEIQTVYTADGVGTYNTIEECKAAIEQKEFEDKLHRYLNTNNYGGVSARDALRLLRDPGAQDLINEICGVVSIEQPRLSSTGG